MYSSMRPTWPNETLDSTGFCACVLPLDFSWLKASPPVSQLRRLACMRIALLGLACLCLIALMACRAARQESRLQGTWRSNKDETISAWKRDGVIPAKVIAAFENGVLGKMSVTYSGQR